MKEYDPQKAARVWQRVQNEKQDTAQPQRNDNLQALIMEHLQLSAMYLQLSRQLTGTESAALMRLAREARTQAACLKGLCVLIMEQSPQVRIAPVPKSASDALLRRCYGQELRLLKEYENRRTDAEYGPVFERMAQRAREHCCAVLELMGGVGRK